MHHDPVTKEGLNYMSCISALRQADSFRGIRKWNVSQSGNLIHSVCGICSQYTILTITPATHSLIGEQSAGVIFATMLEGMIISEDMIKRNIISI